ncbi:hypothetical protein JIR23_10530 [Bradyrhizobium diazoefficiens]|nr:hypothetical protein [Bradyrhizobium diazoefficiens]QQN66081.1 hypothetical protein JIR23_10530 [Bradyrhizobium diazoefficiens]
MSILTGKAGADIRRGDMIKLVKGKLFPALLYEENEGAAAEDIPEGARAFCLDNKIWRTMPPGFRPS